MDDRGLEPGRCPRGETRAARGDPGGKGVSLSNVGPRVIPATRPDVSLGPQRFALTGCSSVLYLYLGLWAGPPARRLRIPFKSSGLLGE